MDTENIFFSYSRNDGAFVLELAKDLKASGASVWLDQLDIQAGSRWDKSIEDALNSTKTMLIVLSQSSVASDNVLDEVSFALEEGKTVVPILLEPCDIPFRLRRLQYADFTHDYDKGIDTLIAALSLEEEVAVKLKDVSRRDLHAKAGDQAPGTEHLTEKDTHKVKVSEKKASPDSGSQVKASAKNLDSEIKKSVGSSSSQKTGKSKLPLIIGAVVVIGLAVWLIPKLSGDKDDLAWDSANAQNSIDSYSVYITEFPKGRNVHHAQDSISRKENSMAIDKENSAWDEAQIRNSDFSYKLYKENYPNGRFVQAASDSVEAIKERNNMEVLIKKHNEKWEKAKLANDVLGYRIYLREYPTGTYADLSLAKIDSIQVNATKAELDNHAWDLAVNTNTVEGFAKYYLDTSIMGSMDDEALTMIEQVGKKGWLYSGKVSDGKVTKDRLFELIHRPGAQEISMDLLPQKGDFLKVSFGRRTYTEIDGAFVGSTNTGSIVRVLDSEIKGDVTLYLQVAF